MTPVRFHREADEEVVGASEWYEAQDRGLGADFLDEVDTALSRIGSAPEAYGFLAGNIRCHRLHRFPYALLYEVRADEVFVVAVMHLHRDPGYWTHRLD